MNLISFAIETVKQIHGVALFYPLTWALNMRWYSMAKLLIRLGADIQRPSTNGNTLLHRAILKGDSRFVKLLVDAGGDVNARNNHGQLPLELALTQIADKRKNCQAIDCTTIKLLINSQANLDLRVSEVADHLKLPLFFYAIKLNLVEAVALFLQKDASLASKTIIINNGERQERMCPADFAADFEIINIISNLTDAKNMRQIDPRYLLQEAMLPNYGTFANKHTADKDIYNTSKVKDWELYLNDDSSIETASPHKKPLETEQEEQDLDIGFDSDVSSRSDDSWFSLFKPRTSQKSRLKAPSPRRQHSWW